VTGEIDMNVYELNVVNEKYKALYFTDVNAIAHMDSQPLAKPFGSTWRSVEFSHDKPGQEGYKPNAINSDFFNMGFELGMSPATAERTSEWFLPYGELLPVKITDDGSTAYWFHCTTLVDALDKMNSIGSLDDDGKMRNPELAIFFPDKLRDAVIFQLPESSGRIYCTDQFKNQIEASGLTGLSFVLEWSDEIEGIAYLEARRQKMGWLVGLKERMLKKRAELEAAGKRS
jgi:hypothetical protein